jgi:hypothetical protein
MASREHSFVREGVLAGAVGATVIAVWFLIIDTVTGHPFYTPRLLGRGIISVLGRAMPDTALTEVIGYTIVHYAIFALIGIIVVAIIHQSERTPGILAGLLVLFVIFELVRLFRRPNTDSSRRHGVVPDIHRESARSGDDGLVHLEAASTNWSKLQQSTRRSRRLDVRCFRMETHLSSSCVVST